MTIRVAVRHHTHYRFDHWIMLAPHVLRLRPAPHCRTPIEAFSLKVQPKDHFINWFQDPFGNFIARFIFLRKVPGTGDRHRACCSDGHHQSF